ncbi:MAG: fasciclin domain-containing protein [Tunicatimonas sp.]
MKHRLINLNRLKTFALALFATVWLAGCGEDGENNTTPEPELNAVELAGNEDQLSTLVEAIKQADLTDALSDESTPITIFAPNNSAFTNYLTNNPDFGSLSDIPKDVLADVLKYHVVPGTQLAEDLTAGSLSTLLDGQTIAVTTDNGVVLNGTTRVIRADIQASNGVIHIIDAVLRTAAEEPGTIAAIASATDDLSTLVAALTRIPALLGAASDAEADLTVFAPTNEAFTAFLEEDDRFTDLASIPDDVLTSVLQYHILAGAKLAAELGESETTLNEEAITISKTDDGVFINDDTEVTSANIEASNGVVHLINKVLLPPSLRVQPTIAGLAVATDDLSTLVAALQRAPDLLAAADNREASLTVFAPTNAAFTAFIENDPRFGSLADVPDEVLEQVLQYHILAAKKLGADLEATEQTLLSEDETLSIDKTDGVVINGSVNVTAADIEAANGVVHLIDQVLLPPSLAPEPTIAAIAADTEALSILVAALQRTPDLLAAADNREADLTVFAPTNDAFVALLGALGVDGLEDIPDYVLRRVLEYHILGAGKLAADLGATETTLEGADISIDKTSGVVINGSSNVILDLANIEAVNGVVHVIDEVLVPPFIAAALGTAVQPLLFDAEERFTTLLTAVESVPDVLNFLIRKDVDGTLFAPTNAAFEALIAGNDAFGSVEDVLAADNLKEILLYHIAADQKSSEDLSQPSGATHARLQNPKSGSPLEIYYSNEADGSLILIGYAKVIQADIATPNEEFTAHAIDAVLLPPTGSVVDVAVGNPAFSELVAALTRVQEASATNADLLPLVTILNGERGDQELAPFTVFAPTNAAFEALYGVLGVGGVNDIPVETLQAVLLYHVISGEPVFSTDLDLLEDGQAETVGGGNVTVNLDNLTITDGSEASPDAAIVIANVIATNGVIHAIDQVLLPE